MINKYEIIYRHDEDNIEVIDQFSTDRGLTVDQALDLCNINMDEYAEQQGWDGYDYNSLDFRLIED